MMSRVYFVSSLLLIVGMFGCGHTAADSKLAFSPVADKGPSAPHDQRDRITEAEISQLRTAVPKVLAWSDYWKMDFQCPTESGGLPEDAKAWRDNYQKMIGREIEVFATLDSVYQISVLVPEMMNTVVRFNRTNGNILETLGPELLCSGNGASFRTAGVKLIVAVERRQPKPDLDLDQKGMLERLETYVRDVACDRRDDPKTASVRVTIPYFEITDPSIFLLIEQRPSKFSNGDSLERLEFTFDSELKSFVPKFSKTIRLSSDVSSWAQVVREHPLKSLSVLCKKSELAKVKDHRLVGEP